VFSSSIEIDYQQLPPRHRTIALFWYNLTYLHRLDLKTGIWQIWTDSD
jgi:hypothetical protein